MAFLGVRVKKAVLARKWKSLFWEVLSYVPGILMGMSLNFFPNEMIAFFGRGEHPPMGHPMIVTMRILASVGALACLYGIWRALEPFLECGRKAKEGR